MNVVALGFRLASGGARFLFVIYLARFATPELIGGFGLIATLTILFTQLAGLELNQVVGRRLHAHPWPVVSMDLARQLRLMLIAHLVLVVGFVITYSSGYGKLAPAIGAILVLEHLVTEVYRILVLLMRTALASFILFTKNVTWMLLYLVAVHAMHLQQSLSLLVLVWLGVLAIVSIAIAFALHRSGLLRQLLVSPTDAKAALAMLKEAAPFMTSALAIGLASTFDRLVIEASFTTAQFGVYFFYFTYASAISLLVTFTIGATVGPRCIKAYTSGNAALFRHERRRAGQLYAAVSAATALALALAAQPVISLLKSEEYLAYVPALYFILISQAVFVNFDPMKIDLYLSRKDAALMVSNIFYLIAVIFSVVSLSYFGNINIVAFGVLASTFAGYVFFKTKMGVVFVEAVSRYRGDRRR